MLSDSKLQKSKTRLGRRISPGNIFKARIDNADRFQKMNTNMASAKKPSQRFLDDLSSSSLLSEPDSLLPPSPPTGILETSDSSLPITPDTIVDNDTPEVSNNIMEDDIPKVLEITENDTHISKVSDVEDDTHILGVLDVVKPGSPNGVPLTADVLDLSSLDTVEDIKFEKKEEIPVSGISDVNSSEVPPPEGLLQLLKPLTKIIPVILEQTKIELPVVQNILEDLQNIIKSDDCEVPSTSSYSLGDLSSLW